MNGHLIEMEGQIDYPPGYEVERLYQILLAGAILGLHPIDHLIESVAGCVIAIISTCYRAEVHRDDVEAVGEADVVAASTL